MAQKRGNKRECSTYLGEQHGCIDNRLEEEEEEEEGGGLELRGEAQEQLQSNAGGAAAHVPALHSK